MIVAIDGPAGAGKSTIASRVARQLGAQLIDTGALYRTVAYQACRRQVDLEDGQAVAEVAGQLHFEFEFDGRDNVLICNGDSVGDEIRSADISKKASIVSAHPQVRQALLGVQRELGHRRDSVLEGRDIGTVVFPEADVKIYLTASPSERARRRAAQMRRQGIEADFDEIRAEIVARDERDKHRDVAPLVKAEDAVEIDSSDLSIDEVVDRILAVVDARSD